MIRGRESIGSLPGRPGMMMGIESALDQEIPALLFPSSTVA